MLLKHIYRTGRAANHQSNTDMENYENRPLNKPITAIISQYTCKRTTESDIVWQNWTQNRASCRKDKGCHMQSRIFQHAAVSGTL